MILGYLQGKPLRTSIRGIEYGGKTIFAWIIVMHHLLVTRIILRVLRRNLVNPLVYGDKLLFFSRGCLFQLDLGSCSISKKYLLRRSPLRAKIVGDRLYFGDYLPNKDRLSEIFIYSVDLSNGELLVTTKIDGVRHIHGLVDVGNRLLWFCGDYDEEVRWIFTDYECTINDVLILKEQVYRAVDGIYVDGNVYYSTDTQLEQNFLCAYNIEKKTLSKIAEVDGPSFQIEKRKTNLYVIYSPEVGLLNLNTFGVIRCSYLSGITEQVYSRELPFKLTPLIQIFFGIPTLQILGIDDDSILIQEDYLHYCKKKIFS